MTADRSAATVFAAMTKSEVTTMTDATAPPMLVTRPSPRTAYRHLLARGFASGEAGNLTAMMAGIPIVTEPWTAREVGHLIFLRTLREAGTWGPYDGAGRTDEVD
jgi:hypothetical protein